MFNQIKTGLKMKFWTMEKSVSGFGTIYDFENKKYYDGNIITISIYITRTNKQTAIFVKTNKSDKYQEIVQEGVSFKAEMSGENNSPNDKYYFDSLWMPFSSPLCGNFEKLVKNPDMMRTFKDFPLRHAEDYQDEHSFQNSIMMPLSVLAKVDETVAEVLECMKEEIKQLTVNMNKSAVVNTTGSTVEEDASQIVSARRSFK